MDVTFVIELACEICDCVYVSTYWSTGFIFTMLQVSHRAGLWQRVVKTDRRMAMESSAAMTVRQPTWCMFSWYHLEPADTEHPCSSAVLVLSWLPLFLSSVLLPPCTISSSLCTPPAGFSPDPKLLWELPGISPGILWQSGCEKCLFQRAEKPEGNVPLFSCYTKLSYTRHNSA